MSSHARGNLSAVCLSLLEFVGWAVLGTEPTWAVSGLSISKKTRSAQVINARDLPGALNGIMRFMAVDQHSRTSATHARRTWLHKQPAGDVNGTSFLLLKGQVFCEGLEIVEHSGT